MRGRFTDAIAGKSGAELLAAVDEFLDANSASCSDNSFGPDGEASAGAAHPAEPQAGDDGMAAGSVVAAGSDRRPAGTRVASRRGAGEGRVGAATGAEDAGLRLDEPPDPEWVRFVVDALPDLAPPYYRRDGRGTWRRPDGTRVPGARDLTLRRLYGDGNPVMRLPANLVRSRRELEWASGWLVPGERFVEVPSAAWGAVADACLGVDAPELNVTVVLDAADVGLVADGLAPATLRSHVARGAAPPPAARLTGPVWAPLVAGLWAAHRPRPGRPRRTVAGRRRR